MGAWQQHYKRAAYIDLGVGNGSSVEKKAQEEAGRRGWEYERLVGDIRLITRLLNGDWDDEFLVLKPGSTVEMTYDEEIIRGV
jgi:hypothetical protein